jgi:putative glycosyltransferase (TIGR04372 family)
MASFLSRILFFEKRDRVLAILSSQMSELKAKGLKAAARKGKHAFMYAMAIPIVLFIRLLRPIVLIRFSDIINVRIGHLVADSSYFLATLPIHQGHRGIYHWFAFYGPSSNKKWSQMVSERLFVRWWVYYLSRVNRAIPGGRRHVVPQFKNSRDTGGVFQSQVERFHLSEEDNRFAMAWMMRRGWKSGQPIVCLLVRDSAYLARHSNFADTDKYDFSYHEYRDSKIETYRRAVNHLLEKGFWVVRLGKIAVAPINMQHERLIDYPFVEDQDDILDIWLTLNCRLFMSTAAGLDILPGIYGQPTSIFVNAMPLSAIHSWHEVSWTPKYLRWRSTGRYLTLSEHLKHEYFRKQNYEAQGIEIVDLSEDDIQCAIEEHISRLDGTWKDTPHDLELQEKFWSSLRQWQNFSQYHGWIHPKARVGTHYLRKMGDSFFE